MMKKKENIVPDGKKYDDDLYVRIGGKRALAVGLLVDQFDRIERMLKWLVIAEHLDKVLMGNLYTPDLKSKVMEEYSDKLPDITDILKEKK